MSIQKIIVNSLPKSGTHLISKCLDLLGMRPAGIGISSASLYGRHSILKHLLRGPLPGQPAIEAGLDITAAVRLRWVDCTLRRLEKDEYLGGHLPYTSAMERLLAMHAVKMIYIFRDPRDVLLSWAHYVPKQRWHYGWEGLQNCPLEDRVRKLLHGYRSGQFYIEPFRLVLSRSYEWANRNSVMSIRFEDLVGPKGGGDETTQARVIGDVVKFVGMKMSDSKVKDISHDLFGGTKVFRKGKIGSWNDELGADLVDEIHREIGDQIKNMRYEI